MKSSMPLVVLLLFLIFRFTEIKTKSPVYMIKTKVAFLEGWFFFQPIKSF